MMSLDEEHLHPDVCDQAVGGVLEELPFHGHAVDDNKKEKQLSARIGDFVEHLGRHEAAKVSRRLA